MIAFDLEWYLGNEYLFLYFFLTLNIPGTNVDLRLNCKKHVSHLFLGVQELSVTVERNVKLLVLIQGVFSSMLYSQCSCICHSANSWLLACVRASAQVWCYTDI